MIQYTNDYKPVTGPEIVAKILFILLEAEHQYDRDKEHFWTLGLRVNKVVDYIDLVSLGSLARTIVEPREVYRYAVLKGVHSIIVAHNHPSGNLIFSENDKHVTRQLRLAGETLGIPLLDHIVINSDGNFLSYHREYGEL